jgi:hypothetical protein
VSRADAPKLEERTASDFFERAVRPVLAERCWSCHGGSGKARNAKVKGGLNLTSRSSVLQGGQSGPSAVVGKPEESLLIRAVRYHDEPRMPPSKRLGEVEIQNLSRWVELGLPWPDGGPESGTRQERAQAASPVGWTTPSTGRGRDHWSFRPVADPPVPDVGDDRWPLSAIDRFILAQLHEHGLKPAPPSDRRTLIRRVTFDLTGLPPASDEVESFLADDRADALAFARVVDRLLASPHYGER